jgi:2-oxoglutarate dehydrogenase E1 component
VASFELPRFQTVLRETEIQQVKRLLICTGKIGHDLRIARAKHQDSTTGIVFLEQLYPWPEAELAEEIARHPDAREVVWVQEEPDNMGALSFVLPRLRRLLPEHNVLSIKRSAAASPATGSAKAHDLEQKTLISLALRGEGK